MSGPLPSILQPLTRPASWGWRGIIGVRNRRYDRGFGVHRADRPVISVGNLTTGGTGKTPMVQWIVERLRDDGHRPAVLLRGYGSSDPGQSDEARLYREALAGVPVLADPDRVAALHRHLLDDPATDCAVLDDGFQHRRLHRDLDLVLVDATVPLESLRMLPAGHLREPLESLRRAHAVVITRSRGEDAELASRIEALHGRPPVAWTDHVWGSLDVHSQGRSQTHQTKWLAGKRFVTRLGIGNADAVRKQLSAAGATIVANVPARDHAPFDSAEVSLLTSRAEGLDGIFMTQKDWVKARAMSNEFGRHPVVVPRLELDFLAGKSLLLEQIHRAVAAAT